MSELEVLDAEVVWDADYEGALPTDWTFEQATEATAEINGLAKNFAAEWQAYMLDAYYHRVWKGLGFDGWEEWRTSIATMKLTATDRKAMALEAKKRGFTTRAIASMQGVSQTTASRDVREPESKDSKKPKAPVPETFTCVQCSEDFPVAERTELEDGLYCNGCLEKIEEAAEYDEARESQETPKAEEPDAILVSKMNQVAKLAAKTPWTPASTARIIKLSTQIQEAMK